MSPLCPSMNQIQYMCSCRGATVHKEAAFKDQTNEEAAGVGVKPQ